jgi:NAD(P)H-hydrate epimerase
MQILDAAQIKEWDAYTIEHEPISSIDLMERAAKKCFQWLQNYFDKEAVYYVFCGTGNNGGDGIAIARLLFENKQKAVVYALPQQKTSADFTENKGRLEALGIQIIELQNVHNFPRIPDDAIVIDALFGSGLNRPLEGVPAELVQHINRHDGTIISIDIPSGLFVDKSSEKNTVIQATYTITFQVPKLSFLMTESEKFTGQWQVLDINLHPDFLYKLENGYEYLEAAQLKAVIHPLKKNTYKNKMGHALLYAGSKGMMGAAVMSAHACLRSGVGLLTMAVPEVGLNIMQTANPQAMCFIEEKWLDNERWEKINAVGIGPGWGKNDDCVAVAKRIAKEWKGALIVDASGLEQFAFEKGKENSIPANAIITPHPGEFDRLFGKHANSFDRLQKAMDKAAELNIYIVLKGAYTLIATPQGKGYYNSTGNAGMGKGGAGDVLTGLLTGLLAQGYTPQQAALLGVYIHGLAGDKAAVTKSQYGMNAMDIAEGLTDAWKELIINEE